MVREGVLEKRPYRTVRAGYLFRNHVDNDFVQSLCVSLHRTTLISILCFLYSGFCNIYDDPKWHLLRVFLARIPVSIQSLYSSVAVSRGTYRCCFFSIISQYAKALPQAQQSAERCKNHILVIDGFSAANPLLNRGHYCCMLLFFWHRCHSLGRNHRCD